MGKRDDIDNRNKARRIAPPSGAGSSSSTHLPIHHLHVYFPVQLVHKLVERMNELHFTDVTPEDGKNTSTIAKVRPTAHTLWWVHMKGLAPIMPSLAFQTLGQNLPIGLERTSDFIVVASAPCSVSPMMVYRRTFRLKDKCASAHCRDKIVGHDCGKRINDQME